MTSSSNTSSGEKFQLLVDLMARLRAPGGCPWDREQTFDTIKPYLLEETYEVLDAIDARDWRELPGELGDLMLQAVFFSQMAADENRFRIDDALDAINQKLVRRHPHVFGNETARTGDDVRKIWSEVKARESQENPKSEIRNPKSILKTVPRALPALVEAQQITSRAANVGFDWSDATQVLEKLREELEEFESARRAGLPEQLEDELGDLLFVLVNLARFVKVDPEQARRKTNADFRRRVGHVEEKLAERGASPADSNIEEMESLWQQAKSLEQNR